MTRRFSVSAPLRCFTLACMLAAASPALAVSEADINRLFAHPPRAGGADINHLLAASAPASPPAAAARPAPRPAPSVALTTTHTTLPLPASAPARPSAVPAAALENMFPVTYAQAEEAVGAALAGKGIADKIGAMMDGRRNAPIYAFSEPLTVQTRGLQVDRERSRWSASLLFTAEDGTVVSAVPAAGHYHEVVEVPVLRRALRHGDVITEEDVELRDVAASRTRPDTVTDLASLIGRTPARSVSPFRPIRAEEIARMPIIRRDAIVQISYSLPGMEITTTGQALAPGARGDVIEVRNTASRKVLRAVIATADRVEVIPPDLQTSRLTP